MYTIKDSPEDFRVNEVAKRVLKTEGRFMICSLEKRNYTTMRAVEHVAKALNIKPRDVGFAGTKDKVAVTKQFISLKGVRKEKIENVELKDIKIKCVGFSDDPISLGLLEGNDFIITIKNISKEQVHSLKTKDKVMPNFFGDQRFSKYNAQIGKHIVKSEWKEAVDLVIKSNPDYDLDDCIKRNDYVAALRCIPLRLLKLYINAYQSLLWNKSLKNYKGENIELPMVGFGTQESDVLKEEGISPRDFIIKKIPRLSVEGTYRKAFVDIKDFKITEEKEKAVTVSFFLEKGSYATVAIGHLLDDF